MGLFKGLISSLVTLAATWAATKIVEGIYNWIHADEIAIQKGHEAIENINN
jgi:hypothetical protein